MYKEKIQIVKSSTVKLENVYFLWLQILEGFFFYLKQSVSENYLFQWYL